MNKNQVMKRDYLAPSIEVCPIMAGQPLLANSPIGGGHNDAGDDETLSAREFDFFDESGEIESDATLQ